MNNIISVSHYNRYIFSITSIWMLIPIYHSYNNNNIFNLNLTLNMFISIIHWLFYKHNSTLHFLDKFFSTNTLFIILYNTNNYLIYFITPFIYISIFTSRKLMYNNKYNEHLINHLIFRYLAFWCCCIYLDHYNYYIFKIYTNIYILTNYIFYKIFKNYYIL